MEAFHRKASGRVFLGKEVDENDELMEKSDGSIELSGASTDYAEVHRELTVRQGGPIMRKDFSKGQ